MPTSFAWIPKLQQALARLLASCTSSQSRQGASSVRLQTSPASPGRLPWRHTTDQTASPGRLPWRHTTDQTASKPDALQLGRSLATAYGPTPEWQPAASPVAQCESQSHRSSSKVLHIIGTQGSGKSTLARAICADILAAGKTCCDMVDLGLHEPGFPINVNHYRTHGVRPPYAREPVHFDFLIVEHLEDPHPSQVAKGDLLIRLEVA